MGSMYEDIEDQYNQDYIDGHANGFQECKQTVRHKEMVNSRSLYGQTRDYQKAEIITLEFKSCILTGEWKILAINETFSSLSRANSANNIVIYASMEENLVL
mgnify:CR=1 FL=1|jgi:hypothetical protein